MTLRNLGKPDLKKHFIIINSSLFFFLIKEAFSRYMKNQLNCTYNKRNIKIYILGRMVEGQNTRERG